jgi:glycerol-3-phosphate dehydrogenase
LVTQHRVTDHVINRLRPPGDGDIIVPGSTVSLAGTTSVRLNEVDSARVTFPEVDFLVAQAAETVPLMAEIRYIRSFIGVRSLDGSGQEPGDRALSRSFHIRDHERDGLDNFMSIFGGKLTTFRLMAEKAADLVCKRLGVTNPCLTRSLPLPSSEKGKWIEPEMELKRWFRDHDPNDTLICECEMVPLSVMNRIADQLIADGSNLNFKAISLRSRVGKGSCQGAFCAFRICGHLYERAILKSDEGLKQLKIFLDERWTGLRPVLWGPQLVQEQLQEAIHCGLFGLEL